MSGGALKSHCCFCSMQCGLELVQGEGEAGLVVKPSPDFPVATGRLCQKGLHSLRHAVHPGRIAAPMRRTGGHGGDADKGPWRTADWDEALSGIADRIVDIQRRFGPDAVAVFGGGSLTNEVCYLLGKFARVALRTKYIDYNGRYCMSSAAAASQLCFGLDRGLTMPCRISRRRSISSSRGRISRNVSLR
jgi:assimilatory nitrate reductase catalytic subunit